MIRALIPVVIALSLGACTGGASLETRWPPHPEDAAWVEASLDRRLAESLAALGLLSGALDSAASPETARRLAAEAAAAAAALRAVAQARAAMAGTGPEAQRALLFAAAAAACHEGVVRIGPRIEAADGGPTPAQALRRAQLACLSCQTLRMLPVSA